MQTIKIPARQQGQCGRGRGNPEGNSTATVFGHVDRSIRTVYNYTKSEEPCQANLALFTSMQVL